MKRFVLVWVCLLVMSYGIADAAILVVSSDGDNVTKITLESARTSADCAGKTVVVNTALTQLQSNLSGAWPTDRALKIENGGSIANSTPFTVYGPFSAGDYKVFNGAGLVVVNHPNPLWWGAVADYTTDSWTGFNAAVVSARSNGQTNVVIPNGYYKLGHQLNVSGVSIIGSGEVGTVLSPLAGFTDASLLLLDGTTAGGASDSKYEGFRLEGNSINTAAIKSSGVAVYNTFENIRINDFNGTDSVLFTSLGLGDRPAVNTLINVHVNGGTGNGFTLASGLSYDFINCAAENIGGIAFNVTSSVASVSESVFISPYIENPGTHGIVLNNTSDIKVITPTIIGYDHATSGTIGQGVLMTGCYFCEIDGGSIESPPRGGSYVYSVSGGARNVIRNAPSTASPTKVNISTASVLVSNPYNQLIASLIPISTYNASTINANTTTYIMPFTGLVGAESSCKMVAPGQMNVVTLSALSTIDPTGVQYYSITLMKNGSPTGLTLSLSTSNYAAAISKSAEIYYNNTDTFSIQVSTSSSAATLTAGALRVSLGLMQ